MNDDARCVCGSCGARLDQTRDDGAVMLRNHGIVAKASGLVLICPKCKHDVHPSPAVRRQLVLFLRAVS